MTLHTQLRSFVGRYGVDMLQSPYLPAIMADEKMFSEPENRPYKSLFRRMVAYDHIRQVVSVWKTGKPSVSTYASAYSGTEYDSLRYALECVGYAMGQLDDVSSYISTSGEITQIVELQADAEHYLFKPDFEEWAQWAVEKEGFPGEVIDFIRGEGDESRLAYRWYNRFNQSVAEGCRYPIDWTRPRRGLVEWEDVMKTARKKFVERAPGVNRDMLERKFGTVIPSDILDELSRYLIDNQ